MSADRPAFDLPPSTHVGRVALDVGTLDSVLPFYQALGFDVNRMGSSAQLDTVEGTTLLVLEETPDAPERPQQAAGLFHVAIRVPSRQALADSLGRIREGGLQLTGASDHLVSEALYLRDPEGNGIEVYRDLPHEEWPRTDDGHVRMDSLALDVDALHTEATASDRFPARTDIGHVHLEVTDLARARAFYVDRLGFAVQSPDHRERASFVAAGDYHHHVGLNTWNGRSEPAGETRGLAWFELVVPSPDVLDALQDRLDAPATDGTLVVSDPDDIELRIRGDE